METLESTPLPRPQKEEISNPWSLLRQFGSKPRSQERCELCSLALGREHSHLIELSGQKILCACEACALLFDGKGNKKYKRASRRVQRLQSFVMTAAQWDALLIPINMAFFFSSSMQNRTVAFYPSPAGAVESMLSLAAWNDIVRDNPALLAMEADIEALLVNRLTGPGSFAASEYFIVPIDLCYRLVGLIRTNWKGLSGGTEAWREIEKFFGELRQRAQVKGASELCLS